MRCALGSPCLCLTDYLQKPQQPHSTQSASPKALGGVPVGCKQGYMSLLVLFCMVKSKTAFASLSPLDFLFLNIICFRKLPISDHNEKFPGNHNLVICSTMGSLIK